MLRFSRSLRSKVVDHNSKEGREYIANRIKHTRLKNQSFFIVILLPLIYVPYHYYVNEPQMWQNFVDPYALDDSIKRSSESGRSETLREKREREARERATAAQQASANESADGTNTSLAPEPAVRKLAPKPAHSGGSSIWLRGGTFKESLDVRPNKDKEKKAEEEQ